MFESDGRIVAFQEWAAKWLAVGSNTNTVAILSVSVAVPLVRWIVVIILNRLKQRKNVQRK